MQHEIQFQDPTVRRRVEWNQSLVYALRECHPDDAAAICAAFLETVETGGPVLGDPFSMVAGDARFWAAAAPPHELFAYTLAGLESLPKSHLSIPARKRVFMALWSSFNARDRGAFLKRVTSGQE